MLHMNMDWFMLIGEEIKDESELFKNLWHIVSSLL